MSFIEKNLSTNEKVIKIAKLHWWIYVKSILVLALALLLLKDSPGVGAFLLICALIGLIVTFLGRRTSEFGITNKRVIFKTGLFSTKMVELQLNKAEGMQISQGFLGRIFNFGSIRITSGSVIENFSPIANPFGFKKQVNDAVETSFTTFQQPSTTI